MKKIRNIIITLVCSAGLFAATMTTTAPTATAAEPVSYKFETCVNVCGVELFCVSGGPSNALYAIEDFLNGLFGC
ncbi:MAG: hypothetical protein LBK94_11455 [Prevotellaceae bacterium]|jgi:hypothetical protein|nr:hypothetical protein [Prevotellaceae bacterium]